MVDASDPRNCKLINTVSLQKCLGAAPFDIPANARQIWVVNVGDLKLFELPIDYYLKLKYDLSHEEELSKLRGYGQSGNSKEVSRKR